MGFLFYLFLPAVEALHEVKNGNLETWVKWGQRSWEQQLGVAWPLVCLQLGSPLICLSLRRSLI